MRLAGRYVSVALSPFKRGFRALQDALRLPSAAVSGVHDDSTYRKIDIWNWVFGLSSPAKAGAIIRQARF